MLTTAVQQVCSSLWTYVRGENGTLAYTLTAVGDNLLAFFFSLVRDLPDNKLCYIFQQCLLATVITVSTPLFDARKTAEDLFVLAFQTRDCRGGKGERDLFYKMYLLLSMYYPRTSIALIPLIREYGSWKDYFHLLEHIRIQLELAGSTVDQQQQQQQDDDKVDILRQLSNEILQYIARTILKDFHKVNANQSDDNAMEHDGEDTHTNTDGQQHHDQRRHISISLATKYAPRENGQFHQNNKEYFNQLLNLIVPHHMNNRTKQKKEYRNIISKCCQFLDITEIKMCNKSFSSIDYTHVPSLCMKKYTKAFLNEKLKNNKLNHNNIETGNRYPNDIDRIESRQHLIDTLVNNDKGIHGGQLYPHEIVSKYLNHTVTSSTSSYAEDLVIQSQWNSMKSTVLTRIEQKLVQLKETTVSNVQCHNFLNKLIPLVDVSGSMSGIPMEVAIALGILISEINHPAFRDRLLTFTSDPSWVDLSQAVTLKDKVKITKRSPWGMSTNIEKAFQLIEEVIRNNNLQQHDIPDLIIFSDMQFDQANEGEDEDMTQIERIKQRFYDLGMSLHGIPFEAPKIIFWNLRGDTDGYPATMSTENVQMLSGYSPSLFHALVDGDDSSQEDITTDGVDGGTSKAVRQRIPATPYQTFRRILDDKRYDEVRNVLKRTREHALALKYVVLMSREPQIPGQEEARSKRSHIGYPFWLDDNDEKWIAEDFYRNDMEYDYLYEQVNKPKRNDKKLKRAAKNIHKHTKKSVKKGLMARLM